MRHEVIEVSGQATELGGKSAIEDLRLHGVGSSGHQRWLWLASSVARTIG
jgi:hypothetical protein